MIEEAQGILINNGATLTGSYWHGRIAALGRIASAMYELLYTTGDDEQYGSSIIYLIYIKEKLLPVFFEAILDDSLSRRKRINVCAELLSLTRSSGAIGPLDVPDSVNDKMTELMSTSMIAQTLQAGHDANLTDKGMHTWYQTLRFALLYLVQNPSSPQKWKDNVNKTIEAWVDGITPDVAVGRNLNNDRTVSHAPHLCWSGLSISQALERITLLSLYEKTTGESLYHDTLLSLYDEYIPVAMESIPYGDEFDLIERLYAALNECIRPKEYYQTMKRFGKILEPRRFRGEVLAETESFKLLQKSMLIEIECKTIEAKRSGISV